ncbi:ATP-binding protein [Okeanomitos corallinicola TIOX110]|uniref:histidine kinase n=1 Tax=Okeanomitos corallinicola TIOX110 TaxID=3133117 RepID=A0ABZ2URA9_9CYAN
MNPVKLSKLSKSVSPKIQKIPQFFFGTEPDENSSSEQFLLSMYDSVQTSIFIVDVLEDGDFCYLAINPTHERWLGISSEELRGKKPEDILPPVDAAKVRHHYSECVQFGKTISYKQCLQFQGVNTCWSTTLTPLKNTEFRIYRLIGTSTNITHSKLAEPVELQKQVQYLKEQIELQKQHYTLQLQQIKQSHDLVRRITEQIRDQVDINQLLQTTVDELSNLLNLERCQIELYNHNQTLATVSYEYNPQLFYSQESTRQVAEFPEIYQALLQKQPLQSVEIVPRNNLQIQIISQLGYPIFDAQGSLGNIWLIKSTEEKFNDLEVSLVQEVANEFAIAIRQSQLQEKTKSQLKELEKRERRKNEFLKTLSQELRTPVTNINLAAQTLENLLTSSGILDLELVPQLLQILQNECGRESKLINDLLTLTYLKIEPEPPTLIPIDLKNWLTSIVESFRDVAYFQKQNLSLNIPTKLPDLETDITDFERIFSELINHACQCTPPGKSITLSVTSVEKEVKLQLSYTGVEIPHHELGQVFQPFYRFTKNEPWKNSDSGLELALVKEMVNRLNGKIVVQCIDQKITFTITFPKDV